MEHTNRKKLLSEIMTNLNAMKNKIHGKIMHQGHSYNITHAQWFALVIIKAKKDMGVKEISKMLGTTSSATTQLVDGLVDSGLVQRSINREDRRFFNLELSTKGQKIIKEMETTYAKFIEMLFGSLSDKELHAYNELHKKILKNL